jgi:hypothetical protein
MIKKPCWSTRRHRRAFRADASEYVASMISEPASAAQFCDVPPAGHQPAPTSRAHGAPVRPVLSPRLPPENPCEALTIDDKH